LYTIQGRWYRHTQSRIEDGGARERRRKRRRKRRRRRRRRRVGWCRISEAVVTVVVNRDRTDNYSTAQRVTVAVGKTKTWTRC
jgi:hypothetical protein